MNWRRSLVENVIEVMLPVIFTDVDSQKIRPINVEVIFEDLPGDVKGFCMTNDEADYIITLQRNQTREELIINTIHELIHVMQTERGDKFYYDKPYREQTHEIEAYNKQEIYAEVYDVKRQKSN